MRTDGSATRTGCARDEKERKARAKKGRKGAPTPNNLSARGRTEVPRERLRMIYSRVRRSVDGVHGTEGKGKSGAERTRRVAEQVERGVKRV